MNTADRLCVAQPVAAGPYCDPAGTAGRFTGGFVRHNDDNWVESWATTFDPKGQPFLNVSIDWAVVQLLAQKQPNCTMMPMLYWIESAKKTG